jgi:hypothetical protein
LKKKLLLILSVVCIVMALTIGMVVPVSAANGARIDKTNTLVSPGNYDATIVITNLNTSDTITITSITDAVHHTTWGVETSLNLLPALPGPLYPPVTIAAGANITVHFLWSVKPGDENTNVVDVAYAEGTNNFLLGGTVYPLPFSLNYPYLTFIPLPELPAGALLGLGVVGLGGFVLIKRRTSTAKV